MDVRKTLIEIMNTLKKVTEGEPYFNKSQVFEMRENTRKEELKILIKMLVPEILSILSIICFVYILILFRYVKKETPSLKISYSLAFVSLFYSLFSLVIFVLCFAKFLEDTSVIEWLHTVSVVLLRSLDWTLVLHLVFMSFNHYFGILWPLKYKTFITNKFLIIFLIIIWIFPITVFILILIINYYSIVAIDNLVELINENLCTVDEYYIILIFFILSLCTYFYIHAAYKLYRNNKNWNFNKQSHVFGGFQRSVRSKKVLKQVSFKTTAIIVFLYIVIWVPYVIINFYFLYYLINKYDLFSRGLLDIFGVKYDLYIILHSIINFRNFLFSIIYLFRIKELKIVNDKVKKCLKYLVIRKNSNSQ